MADLEEIYAKVDKVANLIEQMHLAHVTMDFDHFENSLERARALCFEVTNKLEEEIYGE